MNEEIKKDWGAEFKYVGNLPMTTTIYGGDKWVMRISESGIEVNEEVPATDAARTVLDHIKDMLPDDVQWRPIETAPKDGTVIDLWDGKYMHRVTNVRWGHQRWQDGKPVGEKEWGLITHDGKPTHWMPLPQSPIEDDLNNVRYKANYRYDIKK